MPFGFLQTIEILALDAFVIRVAGSYQRGNLFASDRSVRIAVFVQIQRLLLHPWL
jgi:hypothetical protein